jgi:hypothetical protein
MLFLIILTPLIFDMGCKKQKKCGCGKDVIFEITEDSGPVTVYYVASSKTAYFPSSGSYGSYYYFCNPGKWSDSLNIYTQGGKQPRSLLITGKVFYDCTYLMNSGSYGYGYPPQYQVEVTTLKEDNYIKK